MLTITGVSTEVPDQLIRVDGVQALEQGLDEYAHLWLDGIDASCLPFGKRQPTAGDLRLLSDGAPRSVHVAPGEITEAELALAAARRLLDQMPPAERKKIGALIYCHNTIGMRIGGDSTAAYLHYELGLDHALPFSIGQSHCCNLFVALELANDLINGPEAMTRVMIVAADKWLFPLVRRYGDLVAFADGAGAMLLEGPGGRGIAVSHTKVCNDPMVRDPFVESLEAQSRRIVDFGAEVIGELLAEAGLAPDAVQGVIPQNYSEDVIHAIGRKAGLTEAEVIVDQPQFGHFCSADTPINLARAVAGGRLRDGATTLAWGAGLNGEFACALLATARSAVPM